MATIAIELGKVSSKNTREVYLLVRQGKYLLLANSMKSIIVVYYLFNSLFHRYYMKLPLSTTIKRQQLFLVNYQFSIPSLST